MTNLVEIVVRAKDDTKAGFAAASASSDSLNARLQKIGMIGGAALVGVGVATVAMAAKFDSSMEMIHTQAGVAQNQIAGLKQGVLDLAGKVGFSPDSLSEALYHIESSFASVGITGPKALSMLKIAAEGAAVGHANLVDVTNALDAAIASGIPGVSNMSQAMGILNATVGAGDMRMQDLSDAFGTGMLAVVKGFGLSIKDVGAALAVFGDNNIRGAQAGTELRMAVMALASPAKAGIGVLKGLGITATELGKDMQTGGLMKAVTDLKTHMDAAGLSAVQQGQVITEIFGKKAGTGVNILISQYDRLKSKYPDLAKGASQFGNAWAATQKTASQQFKELEASAEALGIGIGEKLMPAAMGLMKFLTSHKTAATDVAIAVAGLTAVLTLYSIGAKAAATATALIDAAMDANPITLVVIAVAALATAFYLAWEKSAGFRDVIKDIGVAVLGLGITVVQGAKVIVDAFLNLTSAVLDGAAKAFGWVPGIGPKLKSAAASFDGFKTSTDNAFNSMIGTMQGWQRGLQASQHTASAVSAGIAKDFTNQQAAANKAKAGIDNLAVAIGTYGASSNATKTARAQLITDLTNAGVKAGTAKKDVDAYSAAVVKNGTESSQAQSARTKLLNDILAASKNAQQGKKDLDALTTAVKNHGATSDAYKSARAKLIGDLQNAGLNAKTAAGLVDSLTKAIKNVPGSKSVSLYATAHGTGQVVYKETFPGGQLQGALLYGATGMKVPGHGDGDTVMAMLTPGEAVVPKHLVPQVAPLLSKHGVPGFAKGGLIGNPGILSDQMNAVNAAYIGKVQRGADAKMEQILLQKLKDAAAAAAAKQSGGFAGPGGGTAGANAALAKKLEPQWASGANWTAWNNVAMAESGWNNFAMNPGSGAYGIAQALPFTKYPKAGWPASAGGSSNPTAQITWMAGYMSGRYGGPQGAWAHEQAYRWYGAGGATSAGWAAVGEHGRELIKVPGGATVYPHGASQQMVAGGMGTPALVQLEISGGGQSAFDQFMLTWMKENVRVKGGGNVQKAFGRN